jgi:hypothetical protein
MRTQATGPKPLHGARFESVRRGARSMSTAVTFPFLSSEASAPPRSHPQNLAQRELGLFGQRKSTRRFVFNGSVKTLESLPEPRQRPRLTEIVSVDRGMQKVAWCRRMPYGNVLNHRQRSFRCRWSTSVSLRLHGPHQKLPSFKRVGSRTTAT